MKKQVRIDSRFNFNWQGKSLEQIQDDINEMRDLGINELVFWDDDGDNCFEAYINRIETDEEYSHRLEKEKRIRAMASQLEYNKYERLKGKFERK